LAVFNALTYFPLKHGVENRRGFSTPDFPSRKSAPVFDPKNRRRFSSPITNMAEKSDDDAVAAAIMHLYSCKS